MRGAAIIAAVLAAAGTVGATASLTPARAEQPSAVAPGHVPQPKGFYQGAMHGYTPNAIAGGTVVDTIYLAKIIETEHPLLIDVAEKDRKPPSMDKEMIWLPSHRSLPGAVFLQGGGRGEPSGTPYANAFSARAAALTGGDKARPVVIFCHPDCWGSWNAAKRLIGDGYTKVYWYPEGTEGWQANHGTRVVKPDVKWIEALPNDVTQ